ncbi:transposase [Catenulispora sp. EB89]
MLHDRLRRAVRGTLGRSPDPTAGVVDSQSLRAAETVGRSRRGYDAGKKIDGTKRHIAVDTIGLLLTVLVAAADLHDRDGAGPLLQRLRTACPRIALVWADAGYTGRLVSWVAETFAGLRLQIVKRTDKHRFQVLPRRWVVERTLAWITRRRRCVRDYERRADTHEAMVYWALTVVMTRRLAHR